MLYKKIFSDFDLTVFGITQKFRSKTFLTRDLKKDPIRYSKKKVLIWDSKKRITLGILRKDDARDSKIGSHLGFFCLDIDFEI